MLFFRSFSFHDCFCVWLCHICSHWMVPFLDMYHSIMYICTCDMLHVSQWEISCSLCCQIHNKYGLHFVLYVPIHCIWSIVLWCFYRMYISLTSRHFFSLFSSFYLSICSSIFLPAQFLSVMTCWWFILAVQWCKNGHMTAAIRFKYIGRTLRRRMKVK